MRANLQSWVDPIVRKGLTPGMAGKGLVQGKKATVPMAPGGMYTEGSPIHDRDIATAHLRPILKVIGIEDTTFVAAGGTKVVAPGAALAGRFSAGLRARRGRGFGCSAIG